MTKFGNLQNRYNSIFLYKTDTSHLKLTHKTLKSVIAACTKVIQLAGGLLVDCLWGKDQHIQKLHYTWSHLGFE